MFSKKSGFTLIELLIAMGIFAVVGGSVYFAYFNLVDMVNDIRLREIGLSILEKEFEVIRNISFQDVGIVGGAPSGILSPEKTTQVGEAIFILKTFVRNIDDPFDGTIGGNPNDTAPADYKLVELEATCSNCPRLSPLRITGRVSPKNLEVSTKNGSLFINVLNALGEPVSGATVAVKNTSLNPTISITDTTNAEGVLQLVDIPTSTNAYEITVTKTEYSSEKTYPLGVPENPNPINLHATVAERELTQASFVIDKVSSLSLQTTDIFCAPVASVDLIHNGTKLIGTDPDVLKYMETLTTGASGEKFMSGLEWDAYHIKANDTEYTLAGSIPFLPWIINPDTAFEGKLLMFQKLSRGLLVNITDQGGVPLNGVLAILLKDEFAEAKVTGEQAAVHTDWSGNAYDSQSGDVETESAPGEISKVSSEGLYATSTSWLVSKTFDFGTENVSLYRLSWFPENQPPLAGEESIKFQVASNNDNASWNFIGPDGTENSFYTASSTLHANMSGKRYVRYKTYLTTANETVTPVLRDVSITFHSSCGTPDGQAFFNNLSSGLYSLTLQKSGFVSSTDPDVSITNEWQEYTKSLIPQ